MKWLTIGLGIALVASNVAWLYTAVDHGVTDTLTDITKIAVRRPRPIDYINCGTTAQQALPGCSSSDLGLSFFSGHAAGVSAVGATATYTAA